MSQYTQEDDVEQRFEDTIRFTERIVSFVKGSRNVFIYTLGANCCKQGIDEKVAIQLIGKQYASRSFKQSEIKSTVGAAYDNNRSQFGISDKHKSVDTSKLPKIQSISNTKEPDFSPAKRIPIPPLWERLYESEYLNTRGFHAIDFERYAIGKSKLPSWEHYISFLIDPDFKKKTCAGYVKRRIIDDDSLLRYDNSKGAEFEKLLFGYSKDLDISFAILVEGLIGKNKIDHALQIIEDPNIRCFATFGKKISAAQIQLLKEINVKHIIVIFDLDAIKTIKQYGAELGSHFETVLLNNTFKEDLGDLDDERIRKVIDGAKSPEQYYVDVLNSSL